MYLIIVSTTSPLQSFFLGLELFLPTHCRCRWLLLRLITLNDTHTHSVGILWTRDLPVAETSTWQHTTLKRDRHSCPRRDSNAQSQQARDLRLKPRGKWDWPVHFGTGI